MTQKMNIGYADCFSGVSGDMFLGALLHCGLPLELLQVELDKLDISGYELYVTHPTICGIGACKVDVQAQVQPQFRHLSSIRKIIETSQLAGSIKTTALQVFSTLAEAEAKVHAIEVEKVHFHEVGAVDTIVDVVGVVAGLHHLGIDRLHCAPIPMSSGFVRCAHGKLPLPAPAVCEILKDIPSYGVDIKHELVTPTGAALLKVLVKDYGPMVPMRIRTTGYGAGSTTLPEEQPNLFRLFLGNDIQVEEHQRVEIIETNLDDWAPETYPYLAQTLLTSGALDVTVIPVHMKKGRPGFTLQVISPPHLAHNLREIIFNETTAIGLRFRTEHRQTLTREIIEVETDWGVIRAKRVITPEGVRVYPEYEECRKLAQKNSISIRRVYDAVAGGNSER